MSVELDPSSARVEELEALVQRMQEKLTSTSEKLASTSEELASVRGERDNLRRAYRQLMEQFELLRRRIFVAKAERVDVTQLELEFERTKLKLAALAQKLGAEATSGRRASWKL